MVNIKIFFCWWFVLAIVCVHFHLAALGPFLQGLRDQDGTAELRDIMYVPALNAMAWESGDVIVSKKTWYDGISVNADLVERGHAELVKDEGYFVTESALQRILFDFKCQKVLVIESTEIEVLDLSKTSTDSKGRQAYSWFDAMVVDIGEKQLRRRRLPGSVSMARSTGIPPFPDPRSVGLVGFEFEPFEQAIESLKHECASNRIESWPHSREGIKIRIWGREIPAQKLRVAKDIWFEPASNMPVRISTRVEYESGKAVNTFEGSIKWIELEDLHVPESYRQAFRRRCQWNALGVDFVGDVSQEGELRWSQLNQPVDSKLFDPEMLNDSEELRRMLSNGGQAIK